MSEPKFTPVRVLNSCESVSLESEVSPSDPKCQPGPPSGIYRHYKGGLYIVLTTAQGSEDAHRFVVVYRSLADGRTWTRQLHHDGRTDAWEDKVRWPDGEIRQRFVLEPVSCDPPNACATHGRCWPHSEWEEQPTPSVGDAGAVAVLRSEFPKPDEVHVVSVAPTREAVIAAMPSTLTNLLLRTEQEHTTKVRAIVAGLLVDGTLATDDGADLRLAQRPSDPELRCEECNALGGPDGVLLSKFLTDSRWRCYDRMDCFRRMMPRTKEPLREVCGAAFDDGAGTPTCTRPKGHDFHSCNSLEWDDDDEWSTNDDHNEAMVERIERAHAELQRPNEAPNGIPTLVTIEEEDRIAAAALLERLRHLAGPIVVSEIAHAFAMQRRRERGRCSETAHPWGPGCAHDPECATELEHSLVTEDHSDGE